MTRSLTFPIGGRKPTLSELDHIITVAADRGIPAGAEVDIVADTHEQWEAVVSWGDAA